MSTSRTFLGLLVAASAFITFAFSQTPEPEGRVTSIFHDVQLLPAQSDARPAAIDDKVNEGSAVRTGADSRSELTFADLTITRLGANTVFSVNKSGRKVQLDSGSILVYVKKDSGGAEISTKAVSVGITGTTVIFESQRSSFDRLTVLEGDARFSLTDYPDQSTEVRAGELLHVKAGARKLPKPGRVDLRRIVQTHPLIKNFPPLPSLDLILAAIQEENPNARKSRPIASRGPQGGVSPVNVPPPPRARPRPGYPGPSPTPTRPPHLPLATPTPTPQSTVESTPTPTVKPTPIPTPKPTPRPTRRPIPRPSATFSPANSPKSSPGPILRKRPPKKLPTATPTPVIIR